MNNETTQVLAPVETPETIVIFRRWRDENREVIALFPYEIDDYQGYKCSSYMHIGQHGAADPQAVISRTRLADVNDEDVKALKLELERIGYKLVIAKRINAALRHKARKAFLIFLNK